jgi:hypothetical protein
MSENNEHVLACSCGKTSKRACHEADARESRPGVPRYACNGIYLLSGRMQDQPQSGVREDVDLALGNCPRVNSTGHAALGDLRTRLLQLLRPLHRSCRPGLASVRRWIG